MAFLWLSQSFGFLWLVCQLFRLLSVNTGQTLVPIRYKLIVIGFLNNGFLVLVLRVFIESFVIFVNNCPFLLFFFVSLVICHIGEKFNQKS